MITEVTRCVRFRQFSPTFKVFVQIMWNSPLRSPEAPAGVRECAGCSKKIHSQFFLFAVSVNFKNIFSSIVYFLPKVDQYYSFPVPKVDQYWHEDCLKCGCCNCRLGEVRSSSSFWNHDHEYYSWTPCGWQFPTTVDVHWSTEDVAWKSSIEVKSYTQVGQSLYTKGNLLLCKRDYLRLFGSTGYCAACRKVLEREIFK